MRYILTSLIVASLFGIATVFAYGAGSIQSPLWVDAVFWSMIGAGSLLAAIDWTACHLCAHSAPGRHPLACRLARC
ncbi:MAG: hypothetical protein KDG50_00460 [Chromatiales bacterium]|nr:hypothetical protein [Chromatiales bacterium]